MPIAMRRSCWTVLAVVVACTKSEPPTDPRPSLAIEPPAASEPVAADVEPKPVAIDLTRDAEVVTADMAQQWCLRGGEAFRPPAPGAADDDDYPYRLADCSEVVIVPHHRARAGGLTVTHFTIDADGHEQRELVLLQTATHAAFVELDHRTEDTSDMEGVYSRESSVELRDVTGTATPEWIARVHVSGGDCYECDRCHARADDIHELIVCSEAATGFVCFSVTHTAITELTPRAHLGECDVPAKDLEPSVSGYAMTVELRRDGVEFRRGATTIDEPEDPPYEGAVAMSELFADAPLPVEVLATD